MYAPLLVLMGFTKNVLLSYAYSINMYVITLLLVTWKRPLKYLHYFSVLRFARPILGKYTIGVFLYTGKEICIHIQC